MGGRSFWDAAVRRLAPCPHTLARSRSVQRRQLPCYQRPQETEGSRQPTAGEGLNPASHRVWELGSTSFPPVEPPDATAAAAAARTGAPGGTRGQVAS